MSRFTTVPRLSRTGLLLGGLTLLLCHASPILAQDRGSDLELYAQASGGPLWGSDELYRWSVVTDVRSDATLGEFGEASLNSGPSAGFGAIARLPGLEMDTGLSVTRTIGVNGTLSTRLFCRGDCVTLHPLGTREHSIEADLTLLSAFLDVRTLPSVWRLKPFFSVGAGLKVYDFDVPTDVADIVAKPPKDEQAATYRFGAGISVPFDRLEVVARVTDVLGDYSPSMANTSTQTQHDLSATLGLRYRIWSLDS